ncbi:MAG: AMIN domain-containing protein [Candidatus Sericytochromatia bacterium]
MIPFVPSATTALRLGAALLLVATLAAAPADAADLVKINNVTYEQARHSVVLEISGPVTVSTRSLKAPSRLVVDVPASTLFSPNQELVIRDALINRVRISQFQIYPPVVRVVIETATEKEPLIALQQTKNRLYITLAPARSEKEVAPAHGHAHDRPHAPAPTPTPKGFEILPDASPAVKPATLVPKPAATATLKPAPSATPRPQPTATPRPVATPQPAPSIRPPEKRGESALETLPLLP